LSDPIHHSALLTDLYELTMSAAYFENKFEGRATFELFVRSLPPQRNFLIAAGLQQALDYLETVHFEEEDVAYLQQQPVFSHVKPEFFDYLRSFRFSGEVWAMPEGTPVFGEEPLLSVTAPIIEAQIVETYLLSLITFQSMIASKAARCVTAAQGRDVVEFGTRRAHGPEAGLLAARAAYIGGCAGTSNVEAGLRFGVPIFGTLAHSFVMAYEDEEDAFRRFQQLYPEHSILLVDTYDSLAAIDKIIRAGLRPRGVRVDSGDLLELSQEMRRRLDAGGLRDTRIFASGDLDEFAIQELLSGGACVDGFGVGTALATSKDAPALGGVYKLVEVKNGSAHSFPAKFSTDKMTYPGRKQVFRFLTEAGALRRDLIACHEEKFPHGQPLLECVMRGGKRLHPSPPLREVRENAIQQTGKLPAYCRQLSSTRKYEVEFSAELQKLMRSVRRRLLEEPLTQATE
jgi:nicotinate phosphoribosyltransferase